MNAPSNPNSANLYTLGGGTIPSQNIGSAIIATRAPTTLDIRGGNGILPLGQRWVNKSSNDSYTLTSFSSSGGTVTGNWTLDGGGSSDVNTLTGDTGGAISPTAGNINILGTNGISTSGSGSTLTITTDEGGYPITPYVVGPVGEAGYQTIQSAIDAANAAGGGVVYIQPGTYTEDLTLYSGVDLYATPAVSQNQGATVTIDGTHVPPSSGHVGFNSICFIDATAAFSSAAAGSTHIVLVNCESAITNGHLLNLPNWTGTLELFDFNSNTAGAPGSINDGGIDNSSGSSLVLLFEVGFGNGTNAMLINGTLFGGSNFIECPITISGSSSSSLLRSTVNGTLTIEDSVSLEASFCQFTGTGGTAAAITMSSSANCSISNSTIVSTNNPAIAGSGAGILTLTGINFTENFNISSSLTLSSGTIKGGPFVTQYVVGKDGISPYSTIQSALDAANADGGGMVWVQKGTYTEDLTFYDGIQLTGDSESFTIIVGTHTPPASGNLNIDRCTFQDATAIFSSAAAGTTTIIVEDCTLEVTNGYSFDLPNWTGEIQLFDIGPGGTNDGGVRNTGGATFAMFGAGLGNGTGNSMILSGPIFVLTSTFGCPIDFQTGATGSLNTTEFNGALTFSNDSAVTIYNSTISSGAAAAVTMSSSDDCGVISSTIASTNNPAIAGSGAGNFFTGNLTFLSGFNSDISETLSLATGDLTRMSRAVVGTLGNLTNMINGVAIRTELGIHTRNNEAFGGLSLIKHTNTTDFGPTIWTLRSQGTHVAPTIVNDGDSLARYTATGYDGTDYAIAADIQIRVDGTPGADDMPGRIEFLVSPSGSQTPEEALRISQDKVSSFAASIEVTGDLAFQAEGNKITSASVATTTTAGANSIGSVTLAGGTATISTSSVTTNSLIYIWRQSIGATGAAATGNLTVGTITDGVSFVINAVQAADATALQASDVSVVGWMIIN